ncbi:TIGR02444 family protein [Larsenimonas salina]|uniref:TIGR02444 family protein n=1 Tax=Larsenimonas salina TaxID=1295565 RepID=UPI0020731182|nr:TIGR02444 family protein [Larsenimonas salina]MCM5705268.1 TIGR02444 family protein [Larsenimonas salina]
MTDHSTHLWPFALRLYACDGVQPACLDLQDRLALDVCELLWLCWLDTRGLTLDDTADHALAEIRRWQREVTQPLRQCRRALKAPAAHSEWVTQTRDELKRAELDSERNALTRLEALATTRQGVRDKRPDEDLETTLCRWSARLSREDCRPLLEACRVLLRAEPGKP